MAMPKKLTRQELVSLARNFWEFQSKAPHPELFGVTDGRAVDTYVEHLFQKLIFEKYEIGAGSSAKGIDLPGINTDIRLLRSNNRNPLAHLNLRGRKFTG